MNLDHLKPNDESVLRLALQEADPLHFRRFQPIARGPVIALAALVFVVLASAPRMLWRTVCRVFPRRSRN